MAGFNVTTDAQVCLMNCTKAVLHHTRRHLAGSILGVLVTLLIAVTAIVGNAAVVLATLWSDTLRSQTGNVFIVGLSSVDMLTAVFVMVPSAISVAADHWPLGDAFCKFHAVSNYGFTCSSSLMLSVISFDRAIAIYFPLRYGSLMTKRAIIMLFAYVFMVAFSVGILLGVPEWTNYNYPEALCGIRYANEDKNMSYAFNASCFACLYVPATTIAICNCLIILAARKSRNRVQVLFVRRDQANADLNEQVQNGSDMKKTIKSMMVVVMTFFSCFTPYGLSKQATLLLGIDVPMWFHYATTILIFFSSATNPFIYGILRRDFRDAFKQLYQYFKRIFRN